LEEVSKGASPCKLGTQLRVHDHQSHWILQEKVLDVPSSPIITVTLYWFDFHTDKLPVSHVRNQVLEHNLPLTPNNRPANDLNEMCATFLK
jgi:hypothetical protein